MSSKKVMKNLIEEVRELYREQYQEQSVQYFITGLGQEEWIDQRMDDHGELSFSLLMSIKLKYFKNHIARSREEVALMIEALGGQ